MAVSSLRLLERQNEAGAMLLFVLFLTAALLSAAAISIDTSNTRMERVRLQAAADAGAFAGVEILAEGGLPPAAVAEGWSIAGENTSPLNIDAVETGVWNGTTFTLNNIAGTPNAVRVTGSMAVPTAFAKIWGQKNLFPKVVSIAAIGGADDVDCLLPFAIKDEYVEYFDYGDLINVSHPNAGNWGKIDLSGNMSSGQSFVDAMINGVCGHPLRVGDVISPGTGFAGVKNGFDGRIAVNPIAVLPVVDDFYNGNHDVTITGFVAVELVGYKNNGSKWTGDIRLLQMAAGYGTTNSLGAPYASGRNFVR